MTSEGYSPADIAAVVGNNNRNDGDMFGGNGAWWIIILFLFGIFGWGGNWGGNNGGGATPYMTSAVTQADLQRGFDNQAVLSKLDGLSSGICDSTYALNNAITNGFYNSTISNMQGFNGVQSQLAAMSAQNQQCCCDIQRGVENGFAQTNYNLASQVCDIKNQMQNSTRDIVESGNANTRAILDFLVNDKISTLQSENQTLKFAASQTSQNQFITQVGNDIINRLQPPAIPAYVVANPYAPYGIGGNYGYYGYNNGCSCNC